MPKVSQDLIKVMEVMSYDALEKKIRELIDPPDSNGKRSWRYYIKETFPDFVVVRDSNENKVYKVSYTVDASENVTMGQWQEAEYVLQVKPNGTAPTPDVVMMSENAEEGDIGGLTRLNEAAQALGGGKFRMTVIRPGWNSRLDKSPGDKYYTRQYITSLLPLIEGAKSYTDHQTEREERERPQNSVLKLVGYWSEAKQEPDGRATATLNLSESAAWMKPILADAEKLNSEKGIVLVGPSINGYGTVRIGEAEGRRGKIVESAKQLQSIDIVTEPGAGGTVDKLLEGAKQSKEDGNMPIASSANTATDWSKITMADMMKKYPFMMGMMEAMMKGAPAGMMGGTGGTDNAAKKTKESADGKTVDELVAEVVSVEIDKIKEAAMAPAKAAAEELTRTNIRLQAAPMIRELLKESKLPDLTQDKLYRHLEVSDYTKDGALDDTALKEAVTAAVTEERDYLSKLTEAGKVAGMGGGGEQPKPEERVKSVESGIDKMFGLPEPKQAQ